MKISYCPSPPSMTIRKISITINDYMNASLEIWWEMSVFVFVNEYGYFPLSIHYDNKCSG